MRRSVTLRPAPEWRNWHTRGTQNPVRATECGFESHLRHQLTGTGSSAAACLGACLGVFEAGKLLGCLAQGRLVDDRVAAVDALGSVSHHRHRCRSGHARSFEIPNGCPAEVVQVAARYPGLAACRSPRSVKVLDLLPPAVEDPRNDLMSCTLQCRCAPTLLFEDGAQLGRQREHSRLVVLGLAWVESEEPAAKVDVPPLPRKKLRADAPAV